MDRSHTNIAYLSTRLQQMSKQQSYSLDETSRNFIETFDPEAQKKAVASLTEAIQAHSEKTSQKNKQILELRKIKVDAQHSRFLVAEFGIAQADADMYLRVHNNDLNAVVQQLVTSTY